MKIDANFERIRNQRRSALAEKLHFDRKNEPEPIELNKWGMPVIMEEDIEETESAGNTMNLQSYKNDSSSMVIATLKVSFNEMIDIENFNQHLDAEVSIGLESSRQSDAAFNTT